MSELSDLSKTDVNAFVIKKAVRSVLWMRIPWFVYHPKWLPTKTHDHGYNMQYAKLVAHELELTCVPHMSIHAPRKGFPYDRRPSDAKKGS